MRIKELDICYFNNYDIIINLNLKEEKCLHKNQCNQEWWVRKEDKQLMKDQELVNHRWKCHRDSPSRIKKRIRLYNKQQTANLKSDLVLLILEKKFMQNLDNGEHIKYYKQMKIKTKTKVRNKIKWNLWSRWTLFGSKLQERNMIWFIPFRIVQQKTS